MKISDLDLAPNIALRLGELLARPKGLLLLCGPTGSGKTATAEALSAELAPERPVVRASALARHVGVEVDTTIHVIVGDIRDSGAAVLACELAASTLVIATLRSGRSVAALGRLREMEVPDDLLVGARPAVITQQLPRRLCARCRVRVRATVEDVVAAGLDGDALGPTSGFAYGPGSCPACSDGYSGRIALFEILAAQPDWHSGHDVAIEMVASMQHDAALKLAAGLTSLSEIRRVMGPSSSGQQM